MLNTLLDPEEFAGEGAKKKAADGRQVLLSGQGHLQSDQDDRQAESLHDGGL